MGTIKIVCDHLWAAFHTIYYIFIYGLDGAEKQINGELARLKAKHEHLQAIREKDRVYYCLYCEMFAEGELQDAIIESRFDLTPCCDNCGDLAHSYTKRRKYPFTDSLVIGKAGKHGK